MKKIKFLTLAVLVCFGLQSCDKLGEILSINKSYNVNVTVDRSALPASVTSIKVQSFLESIDLEGNTCSIKVIDNNEPQLLVVTDQDNHMLMLYRGAMSENANITINAASTALGIVTFNPLLGPVANNEYAQLKTLVESSNGYTAYSAAVASAVAAGTDLATATTTTLKTPLAAVLVSICAQAQAGLMASEAAISYADNFAPTRPMLSMANGEVLTLRAAGNCPAYYGHLYDASEQPLSEIFVAAPTRYPFMDYFNHNPQNLYGVPTAVTFTAPGTYTVTVSCNERSALVDLYARLITNTLATLGAEVNKDEVAIAAATLRSAIEEHNIQIDDADREDVMTMIVEAYDGVIAYLKGTGTISGNEGNWNLGSNILRYLFANYKEVSTATDAMLRTSWNLADENFSNNNGVISFNVVCTDDGAGNLSLSLAE